MRTLCPAASPAPDMRPPSSAVLLAPRPPVTQLGSRAHPIGVPVSPTTRQYAQDVYAEAAPTAFTASQRHPWTAEGQLATEQHHVASQRAAWPDSSAEGPPVYGAASSHQPGPGDTRLGVDNCPTVSAGHAPVGGSEVTPMGAHHPRDLVLAGLALLLANPTRSIGALCARLDATEHTLTLASSQETVHPNGPPICPAFARRHRPPLRVGHPQIAPHPPPPHRRSSRGLPPGHRPSR